MNSIFDQMVYESDPKFSFEWKPESADTRATIPAAAQARVKMTEDEASPLVDAKEYVCSFHYTHLRRVRKTYGHNVLIDWTGRQQTRKIGVEAPKIDHTHGFLEAAVRNSKKEYNLHFSFIIFLISGKKSHNLIFSTREECMKWSVLLKQCSILISFSEEYKMETKLGEGAYATVFKGVNVHDKREVAIKCISKSKLQADTKIAVTHDQC
jgi:hypothetical protein